MAQAGTPYALVTGAGGFIGGHLRTRLDAVGWQLRCVSRTPLPGATESVQIDLGASPSDAQLNALLTGVSICYHTAGIAHDAARKDVSGGERLQAFNVTETVRLYQAAVRQGVGRFIWLSSSKVLGDTSESPLPLSAPYAAIGSYAQSKVDAEQALRRVAEPTTQLIIVRPPLVYGPGVGANFRRLLSAGLSGWPLPLARATAPRSMIGIANLCDALLAAAQANAGTYQVADAAPVSVARLLSAIAHCADRPLRLFRCPPTLLAFAANLIGQRAAYERLFTPMLLETQTSERALGWEPVHSFEQQLGDTVSWMRKQQ